MINSKILSERYKTIGTQSFFISPTIVGWVDLFTRKKFCDIILSNLKYCIENKNLDLHEFVIMPSHLHLIVQSETGDLSSIIRDFKSFTANQILKLLLNENDESRSEWILRLFKYYAKYQSQNANYMVWQKTNKAIELNNQKIYGQKKSYIYLNPVKSGYVYKPENWVNSSANDENELQKILFGS